MILSDSPKEATIQINLLEKIANQTGLRVSTEKTKLMMNTKQGLKQRLDRSKGSKSSSTSVKWIKMDLMETRMEKRKMD